ncbi:hypothetical protein CC78DRAFT_267596 [Lojkania enalia]|uniref:Uncharacterized protein n=1 Tax=Lojkania enalia TaxID=147567 RepID=A0A9P4JXA8_9PLEO|nr:hypothetical protein CC78DRAFT_267596 [Didymosphaeria enalia]
MLAPCCSALTHHHLPLPSSSAPLTGSSAHPLSARHCPSPLFLSAAIRRLTRQPGGPDARAAVIERGGSARNLPIPCRSIAASGVLGQAFPERAHVGGTFLARLM